MTPLKHDILMYDVIVKDCKDVFIKKRIKYGRSWRDLRLQSHVDLILMKLKRLVPMTNGLDYKDLTDDQASEIWDQLKDTINYCNYLMQRITELQKPSL